MLHESVVTEEDDGSDGANSDIDETEWLDSEVAKFRPEDETIADRLYALRDMVSPKTRSNIARTLSTSASWASWGGKLAGNAAWVFVTSALLIGLPVALSMENESIMIQQEKEMLAQQQGAQVTTAADACLIDGLAELIFDTQMLGSTPSTATDPTVRPPGF